jgi:hypothetical protein
VSWRQDQGPRLVEQVPAVGLGQEVGNVSVAVEIPENRWLLWAGGSGWGPVVELWEYLLVVALVAWALGRWTSTPLRIGDWLLLGVGLTQVPLAAALAIVVWLVLLAFRHRYRPRRWWSYDLLQLVLMVGGMVAIGVLFAAVYAGLLSRPDMHLGGGIPWDASTLHWTVDRAAGLMPRPWVVWLPLWVWRSLALLWSLWLAFRLLRWLPWCWQRLTLGPLMVMRSSFRSWVEGARDPAPAESPSSDPTRSEEAAGDEQRTPGHS